MNLQTLNSRQQEAVEWTEGPLLVLAGAGSGKTRVITHRIAHLIKHKGVLPWQIIALTFTNKAAGEMKKRVETLLGGRLSSDIWISTFHSACVRILRREIARLGYSPHFLIYDSSDQLNSVKECMAELNINTDLYSPRSIASRISRLKNQLIPPEAFTATNPTFGLEEQTSKVYPLYQHKLKSQNALDFDDLLMITVQLWDTHPDVLATYQQRFRYIMVDEYQDTNYAQYRLLYLLTQGHQNICVVGDDDQSIFGWRGATIENILSFEKQFPGCKVVKLEENYRSTKTILDAANKVISQNKGRKGKTLWTQKGTGKELRLFVGETELEEAEFVCQTIKHLCASQQYAFQQIAILYRTNAQSRVLEDGLRQYRIPYQVVGGVKFYDRKEVKDILAYLRLTVNPQDTVSFQRIINLPPRGIGKVTVDKLLAFASEQGVSPFEAISLLSTTAEVSTGIKKKLKGFYQLIQEFQNLLPSLPPARLVEEVLHRSGYLAMLERRGDAEAESRIENIKELISAADVFALQHPEGSLQDFLDHAALVSDQDLMKEGEGNVLLMTLHAAKGLEFPVVFLVGMEEGIFPHSRSLDTSAQLEEERRLCYVGITRAQEEIYFTAAACRRIYGTEQRNPLSSFLKEIPPALIRIVEAEQSLPTPPLRSSRPNLFASPTNTNDEYRGFVPGSMVKHPQWGTGIIQAREGKGDSLKLLIVFRGVGKKKVSAKHAPLELI